MKGTGEAMDEDILRAIKGLSEDMAKGFSNFSSRIGSIDTRLTKQEKRAKRAYRRQELLESDIKALAEIVYDLAEKEPVKRVRGGTAIRKESAYKQFDERGVQKVSAMRALRDEGVIRTDSTGANTCLIRLDGKPQRIIVVLDTGR